MIDPPGHAQPGSAAYGPERAAGGGPPDPAGGPPAAPAALVLPGAASMIARSMGASFRLLPVLGRAVQPLAEFFAPAELLADRLEPLLRPGATVLDLGCGKGGVAQALAARARIKVVGIDAHAPFIEAARRIGDDLPNGHRCRFHNDDITAPGRWMTPADMVLMLGVGPVLGPLPVTLRFLACLVRRGGSLVWGDLTTPDRLDAQVDDARAVLTAAGFGLAQVQADWSPAELVALSRRARRIAVEVETLARRSPMLAADLSDFAGNWAEGLPRPGRRPLILVARRAR